MKDKNSSSKSSFETNIFDLFEELRSAIYWQRPSILFAIHRSIWGQKKAIAALKELLIKAGYQVVEIKASRESPSITHQVIDQVQSEDSVYFIFNLEHGNVNDKETYQALNMFREVFVEKRIKAVFWLTSQEAAKMPHLAPDFWAFRYRVIEFKGARTKPLEIPWHTLAIWYTKVEDKIELDEKMRALEKSLEELPMSPQVSSLRIQLLYELGYTCWNLGKMDKALGYLTDGLDLVDKNSLFGESLRFLNGRAIFHVLDAHYDLASEIFEKLLQEYTEEGILRINLGITLCAQGKNYEGVSQGMKAARLTPGNSKLWNRLGYLYISAGKLMNALTCFERAIQLTPDELSYYESLVACYYLLGWTEKALSELENIRTLSRGPNIMNDIYRQGIMGNMVRVSEMLHTEIGVGGISQRGELQNPNLALILGPTWRVRH